MESLVPAAFFTFIALHIAFGSVGLVAFWVPVIGRKGGAAHKRWGKVFTWTMLATGTAAVGISLCTLIDPIGTHPHLVEAGPQWIRGIFGWMMQGLAILTINLAWYGWQTVRHKDDRESQREWRNIALQALLIAGTARRFAAQALRARGQGRQRLDGGAIVPTRPSLGCFGALLDPAEQALLAWGEKGYIL